MTTRETLAPVHRLLTLMELDALRRTFGPSRVGSLVDVGSGTGRNLPALLELAEHVYAVEPDPSYVAMAKLRLTPAERQRVTWVESGAEDFVLPGPVDGAVISGLFILLTDSQVRAVVQRVASLVRPGGAVYVREAMSPSFTWERHPAGELPWAIYRPREVISAFFTSTGHFEEASYEYVPTAYVLGRFVQKVARRLGVPATFHDPVVNALTTGQAAVERRRRLWADPHRTEATLRETKVLYVFGIIRFVRVDVEG